MSRFHDLLKETTRSSERTRYASIDEIDGPRPVNGSSPQSRIPANIVFPSAGKLRLDRRMPAICNVVDSTVLEHYRRLRTKILQHQAAKPFRTLVVTSPAPEEGKTITVLNLGLSFAMLPGFKILLVDGDLRRGSLGACLGLEQRPGLSNFLDGSATLEDVVLKCEDVPIHFMGRGDSSLGASERLQSFDLKTKFDQLAEHFSLVLVDSPPVNLIADVEIVAAACDAVMLVARGFSTTMKSFQRAVHDLSSFRVIGTVLNGSTRSQSYYRHYRGYY